MLQLQQLLYKHKNVVNVVLTDVLAATVIAVNKNAIAAKMAHAANVTVANKNAIAAKMVHAANVTAAKMVVLAVIAKNVMLTNVHVANAKNAKLTNAIVANATNAKQTKNAKRIVKNLNRFYTKQFSGRYLIPSFFASLC